MSPDDAFEQLKDLALRIQGSDRVGKGLRARRDALIAKTVREGTLTERGAADAAGVSPSYAHRAVVGRTGATAHLKRKRIRRAGS